MNITDQIGLIEAENKRLKAQIEAARASNNKQAGVIEEYRVREDRHLKIITHYCELTGTYKNHFHTFHGSADSIAKQERALDALKAEPTVAEVVNSPAHVATIKERIARIFPRDEKATNAEAAA